MTRPSFGYGVVVAAGMALAAGTVFAAIAPVLGALSAIRLLVPAIALAYLLCLMRQSGERTGRITILVLWSVVSLALWLLAPSLSLYVLAHAAMLWLVRSLYFHSGPLPALLDLGLCALAAAAAGWALTRSGSVFLATWCFFLVQAAFVFIPSRLRSRSADAVPTGDEAFDCARRRADAALRQLLTR